MCSKIFCFDLDMTLLDHKTFHISEKVLKDLEALKKEGHVVAVATGRDMDSEFSKAYKKQLQPDAIVHSNGQKVTVGEKKIREVFMDPKLIARMMEFCREHHLCIGMNIGKYGCYVNKEVLIEHEKRIFGDGDREYIDESNLLTHPFYGLAYFGDPKGTDLLREAFPEIKTPLFADRRGADVITKEVSKANGIQALLDYYQKDWSDGVLKLNPDEADSVVIAGMGGTLVMKILEEGKKVLVDVKELVLQPQSDIDKVRKYLYENDYVITAEKMVCEEEKYYPMMHVQHGHMEELADIEWKYGAFLLKEKNPVLGSFLKKEETTLNGVLQNLRQQPKERVKERILEIEALLALNRKAQKWMKTEEECEKA